MPEDAGVLVHGDHEGDGAKEEEDESDYEHVVEESGVVLAAPVLCLLLPIDGDDEIEGADDDYKDAEDTNAESNAAPESLNVGGGVEAAEELCGVVLAGVETLDTFAVLLSVLPLLVHDEPPSLPRPAQDVERLLGVGHVEAVEPQYVVVQVVEELHLLAAVRQEVGSEVGDAGEDGLSVWTVAGAVV